MRKITLSVRRNKGINILKKYRDALDEIGIDISSALFDLEEVDIIFEKIKKMNTVESENHAYHSVVFDKIIDYEGLDFRDIFSGKNYILLLNYGLYIGKVQLRSPVKHTIIKDICLFDRDGFVVLDAHSEPLHLFSYVDDEDKIYYFSLGDRSSEMR